MTERHPRRMKIVYWSRLRRPWKTINDEQWTINKRPIKLLNIVLSYSIFIVYGWLLCPYLQTFDLYFLSNLLRKEVI